MGKEIGQKCRTNTFDICRFSIFYCGCKQPKSIHILFCGCKGTKKNRN